MANLGIVLGSFHKEHAKTMLTAAKRVAADKNVAVTDVVWVPGSMEKPLALKKLLLRKDIDGALVLGIIERGETKHGFVMASAVINHIIALQLELLKPIGVGIIGPEIFPSQIVPRVVPYAESAMQAVIAML